MPGHRTRIILFGAGSVFLRLDDRSAWAGVACRSRPEKRLKGEGDVDRIIGDSRGDGKTKMGICAKTGSARKWRPGRSQLEFDRVKKAIDTTCFLT